MRRALLLTLALATTPVVATPLRADRTASVLSVTASLGVVGPLPANPWRALRRIELPAPTATAVVALPGSRLAVGLDAPPGVAFLDRDGELLRVARLERRITQPLSVGRDGRVWVVASNHVYTVTHDGAVRSSAELASTAESPALLRPDGSAVVLCAAGTAGLDLAIFSAEGDPRGFRSVGVRTLSDRAVTPDGRVLTASSHALVSLDARDVVTRAPCLDGVRRLAGFDDGRLAMTTDRALLLASTTGVVERRVELPDAAMWLRALPHGRAAVALAGTAPQLHVYTADGALAAHAALPTGTADLLVDPSGAMLVPSRGGDVVALDRDGAERWRVSLHETLRTPAAALPRGGVALATEGDQVLLVTDGET